VTVVTVVVQVVWVGRCAAVSVGAAAPV